MGIYKDGAVPNVLEKGGIVTTGWMKGKSLQARPFMKPALETAEPQMQSIWSSVNR
jgi:hypothetical protein